MIKATATLADGSHLLVLGLSDENVTRLKAGQPIDVDVRALMRDGAVTHIVLWYGTTEAAMMQDMQRLIGPQTLVHDGLRE